MKSLDLGKTKINKLLVTFAVPCIISMLINSVYNIVDQIFIGKGVGTIGNAATNVIFPVIIICNAIASLIGNGSAANLSLKLGEDNLKDAKKSTGAGITLLFIASLVIAVLGEIFLPSLVNLFGCTPNVYSSALTYGRIILLGAPFMIIYTGLSSIIRSDGSPKYSMFSLVIGAIINLILDPIFIFGFNMGIAGGAWATIIGQFVSCIIAVAYLFKIKSIKLELKDYALNKTAVKTLGLGLSSFITQMTVLVLFVVMNNLMTKYGAASIYGADIPLSVYGIVSKINSLYISLILGISIGAQPIIGFNYGAKNYDRVKETLRKVIIIGFIIGITYNLIIYFFPKEIISIFITKSDPNYDLFMKFAIDCFHIFLAICFLNSFEICSSNVLQSLGHVGKSTLISFTRQIILFVPIALVLCHFNGLYGALYAGPIADLVCCIVVTCIFLSVYKKLGSNSLNSINQENILMEPARDAKTNLVITIAREYGSGGHYVGELLAKRLNIPCYDKEIIHLSALKSGFAPSYVAEIEQKKQAYYANDDALFAAQAKIIKKLSKNPCIIIGRCADYILKNKNNTLNIFLYSNNASKIKRVTKYYDIKKEIALKEIIKINKARAKHYKYYTNNNWQDINNYDLALNVDALGGVKKTVELLEKIILEKNF